PTLYLPDGGEAYYASDKATDQESRTTALPLMGAGQKLDWVQGAEDGLSGFRVVNPDGSQDVYGIFLTTYAVAGDYPQGNAVLTQHIDPLGNRQRYYYEGTNTIVRLKYLVDCDGRTNTLSYTNNNLVAQAQNPYGLTASFQ